jgi:hypothetical protein
MRDSTGPLTMQLIAVVTRADASHTSTSCLPPNSQVSAVLTINTARADVKPYATAEPAPSAHVS